MSDTKENVSIPAANLRIAEFKIIGTAPYVQHKFSSKAKEMMMAAQRAGGTKNKNKTREARDFKDDFIQAQYKPSKGNWANGAIPATAIKAAMVAACRLVDFKMTDAKQCVYVLADGYDPDELIPLIRITKGKPRQFEQLVRNATGVADIRSRPLWDEGWEAIVRIQFDADRFTIKDVSNLLMRAGTQVGVGEGRTASRMCVGLGWGAFRVA